MARVHDDRRREPVGGPEPAVVRERQTAVAARATLAALGAQASLMVGSVDDAAEREADDIARLVLSRLGTRGHVGDDVRRQPLAMATRIVRRTAIGPAGGEVDSETARAITSARGHGRPLDAPMRTSMEGAFGTDFSGVRVHTDRRSTELNQQLQARAFTLGSDIFVNDASALRGHDGTHLLAHELTHVVQQTG